MTAGILRPRPPRGMGPGFALALVVHALLIAALAFGVSWRSSNPAGVEAELWAAVPQIAAPRGTDPEPPKPEPKPLPKAEPKPEPKPVAKPEPAPDRQPDAQIAVERARKEEARRLELQREAEKRERQREKAEDERKDKESQEKLKKEQARLEAVREAQMQRIAGLAGATGDAKSTGTATRTAGPSAGYAGRIKARIKPNIIFADSVAGNPEAVVQVRVAPDGTITSRKLMRSSGIPAYDDAVLRAIDKTEVLPRDENGTVPPVMELTFRPNE